MKKNESIAEIKRQIDKYDYKIYSMELNTGDYYEAINTWSAVRRDIFKVLDKLLVEDEK